MCLADYDDGDGIVLRSGDRGARVEHTCNECHRTIRPGERYRFWIGIGDGGFFDQKMCAHCWAVIDVCADFTSCPRYWYWDQVFSMDPDDGGFLGDILHNHTLTARQKAFVRLMHRRGRARHTRRDGTLYPVPTRFERQLVSV